MVATTREPTRAETSRHSLKRFLFHSGAAAYMVASFHTITNIMDERPVLEYGGSFQYLTICGFALACATMCLGAFEDLVPSLHIVHATKRMLALASLPVEITISSIYWPLIIFAPTLMLPPKPEVGGGEPMSAEEALFYIPLWIDVGLHLLPALALVVDFFILEKKYVPPTSTRRAPLVAFGFSAAYVVWVEHCASVNGKFPYPFLTIASFNERCIIYVAATTFALLVFWGLNAIHK